jgi:hypothetical protein
MATSFSAKNGASSLAPESIVVQMSDTEREMSWAEATNAVAAANPSVTAGKTARISELIRNSLKTRWSVTVGRPHAARLVQPMQPLPLDEGDAARAPAIRAWK